MAFRLPPLSDDELSERQRALKAAVVGPRFGLLTGPFQGWIRRPEIGEHLNGLASALRLDGQLDRQLFEIAVLTVANWAGARYMWDGHVPQALALGLNGKVIDAIAAGLPPPFRSDTHALVHRLTLELIETRRWSEESYLALAAVLSPDDIVELVGAIGFYMLGSLAINAFGVAPLTEDEKRAIAEKLAP